MDSGVLLATLFIACIFAGVFVIFLAMRQRALILEMQHRERMAMIERGQVPPPAAVPGVHGLRGPSGPAASSRAMSLGIIVVGLGLALMTIISVAGDSPDVGIGIGGAIVILGAAFIVRSLVVKRPPPPDPAEAVSSLARATAPSRRCCEPRPCRLPWRTPPSPRRRPHGRAPAVPRSDRMSVFAAGPPQSRGPTACPTTRPLRSIR